ncbi:hypothetical protein [Pusillimonas sp. NJUB218]|uniref:hypothetical protein n=1 Tax=Pusillimonas sp. NJUB218 TaxID=2023230 RepID=UPI000F4BF104|nr:hypothetical protein [Pusillimonas sp. NJUB218]ROT45035.1 hypothetical protein CHR62_09295 [Pusillimonas sp. NJUB218]
MNHNLDDPPDPNNPAGVELHAFCPSLQSTVTLDLPVTAADIAALDEAIRLAPIGVLDRRTIAQLRNLRERLSITAPHN